jgi:hypothetical protein
VFVSIAWPMSWVWQINSVILKKFSIFLINIFFSFIIQYLVDYELRFVICFGLFSMKLSQFHDSGHGFCELTRVNLCHFIFIFFQFHHSTMKLLRIELNNCFNLLYLGLSWFYDSSSRFRRLIRVDLICCYLNIIFWIFLIKLYFY